MSVVGDDVVVVADAERAHRRGEGARGRHHVRQWIGLVADRVDVEEDGTGQVRLGMLGARVAARIGQVVGGVHDDDPLRAEARGEPVALDQGRDLVGHVSFLRVAPRGYALRQRAASAARLSASH
jgi:hypothetical protein